MLSFGKGSKKPSVAKKQGKELKRLLLVHLVEARDLIACSSDATSDPYVVVSIAINDIDVKDEHTPQSTVKRKTIHPEWNEKFSFGEHANMRTESDNYTLIIRVFHKRGFISSDEMLGIVRVPLVTIDGSGEEADSWYDLSMEGTRLKNTSGQIHLKLKFNGPPPANLRPKSSIEAPPPTEQLLGLTEDPILSDDEGNATNPNELTVIVCAARNLIEKTSFLESGPHDPYVKLKIAGFKDMYTEKKEKTTDPQWNHKVVWEKPVTNGSLSLTCHIKHTTSMNTTVELGTVVLGLSPFADQVPSRRWYKVVNKNGVDDGIKRGELELVVHWKHNPTKSVKKKTRFMKFLLRQSDTESGDDAPDQAGDDEEGVAGESKEEKEARVKAEEDRKKELGEVEIKAGDYQVQVHIIEARDLKAENLDGTSDPIVYIECFDQRKLNTNVKKSCTSCVFDELFIFNMKNLDKQVFEEGIIKISCLDANSIPTMKEKMIGGWQIDATAVYFGTNHELYRAWVPLMDEEDAEDTGVQGYLKVSIAIIGPGDKLYIHDEEAELAAEMAKEEASGGDVGSLSLSTPVMVKEWKFLVVSVYRAEGLPVMDGAFRVAGVTASKSGTDAFVTVQFGSGQPLKTRTKTVTGNRKSMNPEFYYDLWYPVSVPTMTQLIKICAWDWDLQGNELIGQTTAKYGLVDKIPAQRTPVHWINMYGAPEFKDAGVVKNLSKVAGKIKAGAKSAMRGQRDYKKYYNSVPDKASAYKGRLLIRIAIKKEQERPLKYLKGDIKPFRIKTKKLPTRAEPHAVDYVLKAIFVSGCNLPGFSQISTAGAASLGSKKQDLRVVLSIGHHELSSSARPWVNGAVQWNEQRSSELFIYPTDLKQIPDIFVHLIRENGDPVCFARIKPFDESGGLIGFNKPAQWVLLQEDKCVDALKDGQFPGSVLIKIGFGPAVDADSPSCKDEWSDAMVRMNMSSPYEVRVHLYQAKELMPADANGLSDPYVVVKLREQKQVSRVVYKSLFPCYYQTFVFDQHLPDLEFSDQITFLVYDRDEVDVLDGDDYMGTCSININDAFLSEHDAELPDPTWHELFYEIPGDGEGSLMATVQVIKKKNPGETFTKPNSIIPATRRAYIEVVALGVRDMIPFNFVPMQNPYLEIEHYSFIEREANKAKFKLKVPGSTDATEATTFMEELKTCVATKTSKKPSPSNPNFLDKLVMEVKLPEKALFAQPLIIRARDSRLGGFLTPMVGAGTVDMVSKIPWWPAQYDEYGMPIPEKDETGEILPPKTGHPPTYTPPGSNMASDLSKHDAPLPGDFDGEGGEGGVEGVDNPIHNEDSISRAARKLKDQRARQLQEDEYAATLDEPSIQDMIDERITREDTGAGIFGALTHIKTKNSQKMKYVDPSSFFVDPDWTQDEGDQPPKWAVGRKMLKSDLEEEMPGTPFETYKLIRGQKNGPFGSTVKVAGKFKCLIRVYEMVYEKVENDVEIADDSGGYKVVRMQLDDVSQEPRQVPPSNVPQELLDSLLRPQRYEVRLYALKATNLTGMNVSLNGKPGNSDPYIKVTLGKFVHDDRRNAVYDVKETDLYQVIVIDAELPGASQLVIDVMDKNNFGSDAIIGKTMIDLEDRWFDSRWQELGSENKKLSDDITLRRWETKPIENRSIYVPSNTAGQGIFQCWLDILTPDYAALFPPDDVTLPPTQIFEVRVVIWKAKGVPPMDSFEGMSDLYVKCWPEGCASQDTDVHWRAKKGKASWNWRMKFDVELGHATRAMKFPYLHVQLWDKDLLKFSDCAGEVHIHLGKYYKKAYKKNIAIKLFEKKQGVQAKNASKRAKAQEEGEDDDPIEDDEEDIPPDEDEEEEEKKQEDESLEEEVREDRYDEMTSSERVVAPPKVREDADDVKLIEKPPRQKTFFQRLFGIETSLEKRKRIAKEREEKKAKKQREREAKLAAEQDGGGGQANLDEEEPLLAAAAKKKEKEEEEEDVNAMVSTIKAITGLWEDDPDDSDWLHIEKQDHNNPGKPESMGYICYSVQIWPKDKADVMPVGSGRSEPNVNPFLPPPVGRLKFSLNPFVMGSQLCGPKICFYITCCFFAAGFCLMMVFCQPVLTLMINLCFFFG